MRALRAATSARRAVSAARTLASAPLPRPAGGQLPASRWRSAAGPGPLRSTMLDSVFTAPTEKDQQRAEGSWAATAADGSGAAAASGVAEQAQQQPQRSGPTPGEDDRARFQLHWSVDMWKTFYPSKWLDGLENENEPVPERIRAFTETLTNAVGTAGVLGSTQAAQYWAYHLARSGFFVVQAIAGLLASRAAVGRDAEAPALTRFESLIRRGWAGPMTEALLMYYQDLENIKEGKYALPWDMTTPGHRQFNPFYVLGKGAAFVREAVGTLQRRDRGVPEQVWMKSAFLPEYYRNTFHYQTDGWLSAESAKVYESSTETLFVGRQDAMQRSTLLPLADFMAGKDASQLKALEVAAGTGRFATFMKDNFPGLQLTVSDLSPFYLAEARNNMRYWKRMRARDAELGGPDGSGVTFLQTAAEKLDVPDESQDVVYCVYLFHELPLEIRRQAAAEMARVVKPGGIVILTDSAQLGDRDVYEQTLGNFGNFNEPYYRSYVETPIGPLFEEAGLKPGMKVQGSTTKTLSFTKPTPNDRFAAAGSSAAAAQAAVASVAVEALEDE